MSQCPAELKSRLSIIYCVRSSGHAGEHRPGAFFNEVRELLASGREWTLPRRKPTPPKGGAHGE